jgi:putative toxin-antitoxin system antitoxin component (TIGR02293 family)
LEAGAYGKAQKNTPEEWAEIFAALDNAGVPDDFLVDRGQDSISFPAGQSRTGAHMKEGAERPSLLTSLRLDLESVEAGVPVETITSFVLASGVELKDVNAAVISARALRYRRSRKQSLSLDESDRLARLVRIFDQAVSVFGDAERARRWLSKPKKRFHERTPLQMLRTDFGGRAVEEMLVQIDEGMFA